jgi:hypothetical protein
MEESIFDKLESAGFGKVEIEDKEREIKPINGKYVCRLLEAGNRKGVSERTGNEYDFWSIKCVVTKNVSGDKGVNRRADRLISFKDSEWSSAKESMGKYIGWLQAILNGNAELTSKLEKIAITVFEMSEAGADFEDIMEKARLPLDELSKEAVGTLFLAKISPAKDKEGKVKMDGDFPKQTVLPMKEFKEKGKLLEVKLEDGDDVMF